MAMAPSRVLRKEENPEENNTTQALRQQSPSSPVAIKRHLRPKEVEDQPYCQIEVEDVLNEVKSYTQLRKLDGLRVGLSIQPYKYTRFSTTWNFLNMGRSIFSFCSSIVNETKLYPDFLSAEISGTSVNVLGSWMPLPEKGILLRADASLPKIQKLSEHTYNIELRKLCSDFHIGIQKSQDSASLLGLYKYNNQINIMGKIEASNDFKHYYGEAGMSLVNGKHKASAVYKGRNSHELNIGYIYEHSNLVSFATEHIQQFGSKISESILGLRVRFTSGEVRCSLSSSLKASSEITHVIDKMIMLRLFGEVDFSKESASTFGISLDLGSLTL